MKKAVLLLATIGLAACTNMYVGEQASPKGKEAASLMRAAQAYCLSSSSKSAKADFSAHAQREDVNVGVSVNLEEVTSFFNYYDNEAIDHKERNSIRECMKPYKIRALEVLSNDSEDKKEVEKDSFKIKVVNARRLNNRVYYTILYDNQSSKLPLHIVDASTSIGVPNSGLRFGQSLKKLSSDSPFFDSLTVKAGESQMRKYKASYKNYFRDPKGQNLELAFDVHDFGRLNINYATIDFTVDGIEINEIISSETGGYPILDAKYQPNN